jgi:hypothetical protein
MFIYVNAPSGRKLNNDELMVAYRAGDLAPKPPKTPRAPLPKGLGKVQREVYIRVCLLTDLRRADGRSEKERIPLAATWLADELDIEYVGSVLNALRGLVKRGLLRPAGTTLPKGYSEHGEIPAPGRRKRIRCYVLGERAVPEHAGGLEAAAGASVDAPSVEPVAEDPDVPVVDDAELGGFAAVGEVALGGLDALEGGAAHFGVDVVPETIGAWGRGSHEPNLAPPFGAHRR